jgi:hypothetical protein
VERVEMEWHFAEGVRLFVLTPLYLSPYVVRGGTAHAVASMLAR